jgi:hypothetical protein
MCGSVSLLYFTYLCFAARPDAAHPHHSRTHVVTLRE